MFLLIPIEHILILIQLLKTFTSTIGLRCTNSNTHEPQSQIPEAFLQALFSK